MNAVPTPQDALFKQFLTHPPTAKDFLQIHLDAGHTELPLVIPVLFYHGLTSPYPYSMSWLDTFGNPTLAGQIYGGHFPLVDVTVIPDDVIMTHRRRALLELLLKHIWPPALAQKKPQPEGRMMTIAERLRQEGMREGMKEGREIARKEHNEQLARLMLSKKYDLASIMELTGMTESELKKLQC